MASQLQVDNLGITVERSAQFVETRTSAACWGRVPSNAESRFLRGGDVGWAVVVAIIGPPSAML